MSRLLPVFVSLFVLAVPLAACRDGGGPGGSPSGGSENSDAATGGAAGGAAGADAAGAARPPGQPLPGGPVVATKLTQVSPQRLPVRGGRLIVLGFDGVDPRRVDGLIAQGRLPNLQALGQQGYRGPLATTTPPQSPVAWAAFATGVPAGAHGIFDFVKRDPKRYLPKVATTRVTHASVKQGHLHPASARNLRQGEAFWDVLARDGVPVTTLFVPYAFPPSPQSGARAIAGLGTPDVRGTNSSFTLLTTDAKKVSAPPPAGGQVAALEGAGAGVWRASVAGPVVRVDGARRRPMVPVVVRLVSGVPSQGQGEAPGASAAGAPDPRAKVQAPKVQALEVQLGGKRQLLTVGQTGDYQAVAFTPHPQLSITAATRVTVLQVAPHPQLYLEPLSIVPQAPYLPLAQPPEFAGALWHAHGAAKTVGWVHDTSAVGAGVMSDAQFVREALATMRWREQALQQVLKARQDRVLVAVFTAPDRIGHMMYRYVDPGHPAAAKSKTRTAPGTKPDPSLASSLDQAYEAMDTIVGGVRKQLGPEDVLLVMSDHGFASFRRGFHLNRWLISHGYMALRPGATEGGSLFRDVDWSKTKAYALGTGSIYLNIRGREGQGVVSPRQAPALAQEIARKLRRVRDKKGRKGKHTGAASRKKATGKSGHGTRVVLDVAFGDAIYAGAQRSDAPDLRVALAPGYRASWATALGGAPLGLFEDNTRPWSGDHASARPQDVPGILVSSHPVTRRSPRIEDIGATAFQFVGRRVPAEYVGRPLWAPMHADAASR